MVNIEEKNKTLENYFSNEKQEITLEITDTYKIKDYSNEYIAKVIKINTSDVSKNIKSLIRVPSNFELKK
jgi:DNA-binding MarR family transcriptional regulator